MRQSKRKQTIRITGLVKAMNHARQRLKVGIPQADTPAFRNWVKSQVSQIEQICTAHGVTPQELPAPSRRAYLYLKGIDLDHLPPPQLSGQIEQPCAGIRITNLVAIANRIQAELSRLAAASPSGGQAKQRRTLQASIEQQVARTEAICAESACSPGDLPAPSQRAYAWLKFLSSAENLHDHLETLRQALKLAQAGIQGRSNRKSHPGRGKRSPGRSTVTLQIEFYNIPAIYRARQSGSVLRLVASQGFIGAPEEILRALIGAALTGKDSPDLQTVRIYADGEEFAELLAEMNAQLTASQSSSQGSYFDLQAIFQRLNQEYFAGRLEQPRLVWNKTLTARKLGHYQPASDTILISISLDQPQVPPELVEFVIYHEMLHKELGMKTKNGRRYAHTPEFRARERLFRHYERCRGYLQDIGSQLFL